MEGNVFMEQWNEYLEALASKAPTPGAEVRRQFTAPSERLSVRWWGT